MTGAVLSWRVVERFVGLAETVGCVLVVMNGGLALENVAVMLCRWWVVESYIWGLLLLCIVQSPNSPIINKAWWKYLSVVHAHLAQYNKQQVENCQRQSKNPRYE